jgi:glycosyltransferase involved in cell wall biosynthesis
MVLNLASALPCNEFETHVCALIGSGALIGKARELGLSAEHFHFRNPADPTGIWRLIRYCRKHKIDIVQTHGLRADAVARWAVRLGGVQTVISTLHSIDPWRRGPHVMLDKLTAPFVTHYVAVCDAARQAAINRGEISADKCAVVNIGVPAQQIPRHERDAIRTELDLSPDDYPVVGVLANLRDMKGHRHIIAALPEILSQNPEAKFLFAGRDDSNGAIEEAARQAGVGNTIRFLGFVEHPSRLFAAMDIFLLPSDWEGFPVSILEAMQAGVPVVATAVGGIPVMFRPMQDGILVPPKNPAKIAEAINLLAKDFALRASLVKSADTRYQADFTLTSMADRMAHLYNNLLKKAC